MKIKQAHGNSLRLPLNEFLHLYNHQAFPLCFFKNHVHLRHHHEKWDSLKFVERRQSNNLIQRRTSSCAYEVSKVSVK